MQYNYNTIQYITLQYITLHYNTIQRYAIEDTLQKFPDCSDLYVICDGDVGPFNISGGDAVDELSWRPESNNGMIAVVLRL